MKPNKKFDLTVKDIEIIEQALRAKAGRRGMRIMTGENEQHLHNEMKEIQDLLGRLHQQKNMMQDDVGSWVWACIPEGTFTHPGSIPEESQKMIFRLWV